MEHCLVDVAQNQIPAQLILRNAKIAGMSLQAAFIRQTLRLPMERLPESGIMKQERP